MPNSRENTGLKQVSGEKLSALDEKIHSLFVAALKAWGEHAAVFLGLPTSRRAGLPVGLPASGLVANLSLIGLDSEMRKQVKPYFYGRYVDDIVIVLKADEDLDTSEKVLKWVSHRIEGLSFLHGEKRPGQSLVFKPDYLSDSKVVFGNKKNRAYFLEGTSGRQVLKSLRHTINQRSSEWRSMAELPDSPGDVSLLVAEATDPSGDLADSLSKMERLSATRGGFSLVLRDVEAYQRDVASDSWIEHRKAFLSAVREYILVLPTFFKLAAYLPRIIKIALNNGEVQTSIDLIKDILHLVDEVKEACSVEISSFDEYSSKVNVTKIWKDSLIMDLGSLIDSIAPDKMSFQKKEHVREFLNLPPLQSEEAEKRFLELFGLDLADVPFRDLFSPKGLAMSGWDFDRRAQGHVYETVSPMLELGGMPRKIKSLVEAIGQRTFLSEDGLEQASRINGLVFPTRPLQIIDVLTWTRAVGWNENGRQKSDLADWLLVTRGFDSQHDFMPNSKGGHGAIIELPIDEKRGSRNKVRVAVGSLKTEVKAADMAIHGQPDLSFARYQRIASLINQVASTSEDHPDYLLLPELSIPARWFNSIARRLKSKGISLIAGVEYIQGPKNELHNQLWASLIHNGFGFSSAAVYRQDKLRPAPGERTNLDHQNGSVLIPDKKWTEPPVIHHGDFAFAMLICSELTNINHRAALRGKIDALFVAEWNKDLATFQALVESAALDIHAFVIQANNREYGDSRIRAPYKKDYQRDIVRVRGGMHDHFVVGELPIRELRSFQSRLQSSSGLYKPTPDNFEIDFARSGRRWQIP